MNRNLIARLGLMAFFFLVLASCKKKDRQEQLTAEIDRICDSVISSTTLPGMVVGIWSDDFTYLKGRGLGNLNPRQEMDPRGAFRIGSNTKTFVVTNILQLVEEQKLSLDDTLGRFFPGFQNGGTITIRMLCNMTSGIPNYTMDTAFERILEQTPLKKWTPQELVGLVKNKTFVTPGTAFEYSNTNTILLGMIIEQLTGKSLGENLKTRFFNKLAMTNTIFPFGADMPPGAIRGYMNFSNSAAFIDDVTERYDLTWAWAAGSVISDIASVKTWVEALVDGQFVAPLLQEQRFIGKAGAPITYGLGMFSPGRDMWGHNGGLPGYTSIMMHHRSRNITYVIFYNIQDTAITPDNLYMRLLSVVNPEL